MDSATYNTWQKIKSLSNKGISIYHCSNINEVRRVNELANAGYITVSWKTTLDVVFYIAGEIK